MDEGSGQNKRQEFKNLTLAGIAGLSGGITLVEVLVALFLGMWLDKVFSTKYQFTVGLILISIPVTLITMYYFVKTTTSRIVPGNIKKPTEEDVNSGKNP